MLIINKYDNEFNEIKLYYKKDKTIDNIFTQIIKSNELISILSNSEFLSKKISITNNIVYIIYGFDDIDGVYDEEIETMSESESNKFIEWLKFHILTLKEQRKLKLNNLRNN